MVLLGVFGIQNTLVKKLTGYKIFGGKLMGYGILRSDKTGYWAGKSEVLQLELTGYYKMWDTQSHL